MATFRDGCYLLGMWGIDSQGNGEKYIGYVVSVQDVRQVNGPDAEGKRNFAERTKN